MFVQLSKDLTIILCFWKTELNGTWFQQHLSSFWCSKRIPPLSRGDTNNCTYRQNKKTKTLGRKQGTIEVIDKIIKQRFYGRKQKKDRQTDRQKTRKPVSIDHLKNRTTLAPCSFLLPYKKRTYFVRTAVFGQTCS